MLIRFKDPSGSPVVINTDHLMFVAQAADAQTKKPVLGQSLAMMVGGFPVALNGSPTDVTDSLMLATISDEQLVVRS